MHADKGDQVDVIYIDLKKAFEKVSHCHLLNKLCNLGLGTTVDWIKQFLIGRSQTVSVDKVPSHTQSQGNQWCSPGLGPWPSLI